MRKEEGRFFALKKETRLLICGGGKALPSYWKGTLRKRGVPNSRRKTAKERETRIATGIADIEEERSDHSSREQREGEGFPLTHWRQCRE